MSKNWFVYCPMESELTWYESQFEALDAADVLIKEYNDGDGWPSETEGIKIGYVTHQAKQVNTRYRKDVDEEELANWGKDWEFTCEFEMLNVNDDE